MLRRYFKASVVLRRNISALFVTGDKAKETFAVLTPVLNFDERFNNFQEIHENIRRRKLTVNFDDLKSEYELYSSIKERKKALEGRRVEIGQMIRDSPNDAEGLKLQGVQVSIRLREARIQCQEPRNRVYELELVFINSSKSFLFLGERRSQAAQGELVPPRRHFRTQLPRPPQLHPRANARE